MEIYRFLFCISYTPKLCWIHYIYSVDSYNFGLVCLVTQGVVTVFFHVPCAHVIDFLLSPELMGGGGWNNRCGWKFPENPINGRGLEQVQWVEKLSDL